MATTATQTATPTAKKPIQPAYLSLLQVCELLGNVGRNTVRDWIRDRGFPAPISVSTKTKLYERRAVLAWMKAQARKAKQAGIKEAAA